MNKFFPSLCFLMVWHVAIFAQNPALQGDSMLRQELMMTKYDKDTSVDAVILSDIGSTSILADPNGDRFRSYFTRTVKFKIFSESGFSHGTWAIPLLGKGDNADMVLRLKATTYNLVDGKIIATPLNDSDIHYEKDSKYFTVERFALPDIKIGSVISVSYKVKSSNIINFGWNFQSKIPVEYSQFTVTIPSIYSYMCLRQRIDTTKLIYTKWRDSVIHYAFGGAPYYNENFKYMYRDIPAFKEEAFISSPEDYMAKVKFQFYKMEIRRFYRSFSSSYLNTWKQFNDGCLNNEYFGGYMESKWGALGKIVEKLKIDNQPQLEKIKTIVDYMKNNYKWNNIYSDFADQEMGDFIKKKIGNSADINLCLIAMLRIAQVDAYPVILSTREHGKIKTDYPFAYYYNDVICYVKTDSIALLLDATEPLLPYYALPSQCMNDKGLIVRKNDSEWVNIQPRMSSLEMKNMVINFSPNYDSINSEFTIKANGYMGYQYRKAWNEGYDKFTQMLIENKGIEIKDSVKTYDVKNPEEAMSVIYSASCPLIKQKIDSTNGYQIIFSPFLKEPVQENPLKMSEREYPVDMNYPRDFKYQSIVVIPDGYKIKEEPVELDKSVLNGKAVFSYKIKQISKNAVQFSSDLSFNQSIFYPDEYKELKSFYDTVIKKYKEPVVIEKD